MPFFFKESNSLDMNLFSNADTFTFIAFSSLILVTLASFLASFSRSAKLSLQSYGSIMRDTFDTGRFWFNYSLNSVNAIYVLPHRRLLPIFGFSADPETLCRASLLWSPGANELVKYKLSQRAMYLEKLAALFEEAAPSLEFRP